MRAYNNLLVVLDAADRIEESFELGERAIELARRVGDRHQEAAFVGGSVGMFYLVGRWDEALSRAQEASELASTAFAQSNMLDVVFLHCERGNHGVAQELLERFAAVGEAETAELTAGFAVYEARVLRAEGKLSEALESAERAFGASAEMGVTSYIAKMSISELLETALELGDLKRAEDTLAVLDRLRPGELTPVLRATRARFRGRLAALRGDREPDQLDRGGRGDLCGPGRAVLPRRRTARARGMADRTRPQ